MKPLYNGYSGGVPNSEASGIFSVGVACVIGLLSTTWLHFESFPLLYACREPMQRLVLHVTVLYLLNVKLLTTAATVDNRAEKVDECSLNRGRYNTEWRGVKY